MKMHPDPTAHCDLTAQQASEYSGVTAKLYDARKAAKRKAAEEFSRASCWMMAAWVLGFIALLSTCLILWCRQPDVTPSQLQTIETQPK